MTRTSVDGVVEASETEADAALTQRRLSQLVGPRTHSVERGARAMKSQTPEGLYPLRATGADRRRPMLKVLPRACESPALPGSELFYAPTEPGQDPRHVGLLEPVWNLFDLTPEGRPDWDEQLVYP
jgi:hypothetical protein